MSDDPTCRWDPDEYPLADDKTIDDGTVYYVARYSLSCAGKAKDETVKGFITVMK